MDQQTVRGVVLSAMPIGEYDKRIVLLTKERGKITAFARGARRQNSQFLVASQPTTFGEYTVYQGRNAYTLTGVKVNKYFADNLTDIEKMSYAMYFLEVCDYFGREGIEAGDAIDLLYLAIKVVTNSNVPHTLIRRIFELRMLYINGEYPDFFTCKSCGGESHIDAYRQGYGLMCRKCHTDYDKGIIKLDESALYTLQYILTSSLSKLFTFTVADEVLSTVSSVIQECFTKVVDRKFRSLDFIQ